MLFTLRDKRNVMAYYLQVYLALFRYNELHTMIFGNKKFQNKFMKINNILSGVRYKYISSEVNLYKNVV